jgi:plastocyanin
MGNTVTQVTRDQRPVTSEEESQERYPTDTVHSGFILQALDDQPGKPVNSDPDNAIALNPTHFRVKFIEPGTYNYKCVLHDDLGMVGQVVVVP